MEMAAATGYTFMESLGDFMVLVNKFHKKTLIIKDCVTYVHRKAYSKIVVGK